MLRRDLWHLRGQILAAALVVACGVAALVATRGTYESLVAAQEAYYAQNRFADIVRGLNIYGSKILYPDGLATASCEFVAGAGVDTVVMSSPTP